MSPFDLFVDAFDNDAGSALVKEDVLESAGINAEELAKATGRELIAYRQYELSDDKTMALYYTVFEFRPK